MSRSSRAGCTVRCSPWHHGEVVKAQRAFTASRGRKVRRGRPIPPAARGKILDAMIAGYEFGESSLLVGGPYGAASTTLRLLHDCGVEIRIGKVRDANVSSRVELYDPGLIACVVDERFGSVAPPIANALRADGC